VIRGQPAPGRGRTPVALVMLSAAALAVALYLTLVKLAGAAPVCGILEGCETVSSSPYSELFGIPVALFGAAGSLIMLAGALAWWRTGARSGVLLAYLIGLASLPVLAYLTYLEIAVIGAICIWCVTYAVLTIGAFAVAAVAVNRRPAG
jgi:uncharacterized membrane protein